MPSLPDTVVSFLDTHVPSIEALQVLMACIDGKDRWWDAGGMARETGISVATARQALDTLARRNLLDIKITGDVRYRFAPGQPAVREAALACATAYRTQPLAVVKLIVAASGRTVRDFADAFRIRRDDDR
jgi:hypothetical protein